MWPIHPVFEPGHPPGGGVPYEASAMPALWQGCSCPTATGVRKTTIIPFYVYVKFDYLVCSTILITYAQMFSITAQTSVTPVSSTTWKRYNVYTVYIQVLPFTFVSFLHVRTNPTHQLALYPVCMHRISATSSDHRSMTCI